MNMVTQSLIWGVVFSFQHIIVVTLAVKLFKKIAPVLLHAASACGSLILMCLLSSILSFNRWFAFSILAFSASSFLFLFGTIYKSMMIRILCFLDKFQGRASIEEINNQIINPTFLQRCLLLVEMGNARQKKELYLITSKGEKMAGIIKYFRNFFNIKSSAMYRCERKRLFWKKLFNFQNHSKLLIFVIYFLLASTYFSGLVQKLYRCADPRIKIHAIPVAISTLYQKHKHDYRGWLSTERPFQGLHGKVTDKFILEQIKAPVDKEAGHYYWVADDRGYLDFVIGSFALFGSHIKSLYHFWFLILFLSISLFVISFRKQPWALAYLAFVILGIHSAMSILKYIHIEVPVFEPRYLDVLAIVSILHMIFVGIFVKNNEFFKHLAPLIGQILIFVFLYHSRSSLGWEIVAVVLTSLFHISTSRSWRKAIAPLSVAVILIVSCSGLLSIYKHFTYHPSYFREIGQRTFWHNALMGMHFKTEPKLIVCDDSIAKCVIEHARESGCTSKFRELSSQDLLNSLGNWGTANWKEYEYWAKKLYFSMFRKHKFEAAKLYLFDKPLKVLKSTITFRKVFFPGETKMEKQKPEAYWNPLQLCYLIAFLSIAYIARDSLFVYRWKLLGISLIIYLCGMIPSVLFYSAILTQGGMSVIKVVILCYGMILCLPYVINKLKNYKYKVKINED